MTNPGQEAVGSLAQYQGEINNGLAELAERIRSFSQEQTEVWRQIPYLALRAEGITGYNDTSWHTYQLGLRRVGGSEAVGVFGTFVDCENGNILQQNGKLDTERRASDIQVVEAWLPDGGMFDAQGWLDRYHQRANRSFINASHEKNVRAWQDEKISKLGLTAIFSRSELTQE